MARTTTRRGARARRAPKDAGLTRDAVLAFIAEHPDRTTKRDIARGLGVSGNDRILLKRILRELADEGVLQSRRRRFTDTEGLPSVTVLEIVSRDDEGDLIARPAEWDQEAGIPAPVVRVQTSRKDRGARVAGIGDRILARLQPANDAGTAYTARIIKVLPKRTGTTLGVVRLSPHGARIEPVDRKQKELILDADDVGDAKEGDLVVVTPSRDRRYGLKRGRIASVVGSMKQEKAVSLIALHAHGIPYEFPDAVLSEAAAIKPAAADGRDDWREMPLVTIDPADAKDHDDAVWAEPDKDPANKDGHIVVVAIADVAQFVRPGSQLDRTALERGNSVYFPDQVVPMLPERISNDLCSLRENEDRAALAVRMVFGADGRKRSHRFHRIVMRSHARLSYQQAQTAFDGDHSHLDEALREPLDQLWSAYRCLSRGRDERQPLDLDLPERKIVLDRRGHVDRVIVPERLEAHRLIEEFMIQANVAAAETLEQKSAPVIYRVHDNPSLAKLEALRDFLKTIDLPMPRSGAARAEHFNRLLAKAVGTEHETLLSEIVLRTQSQAEYSVDNIGHFGLNLRRYAHFTSPIRRYADLIVHRSLIRALRLGEGGLPETPPDRLADIAERISDTERRAMAAERDTVDRLVAHWLADRVGASFTGRIAGVTRAGLFVKLDETGADGFVPMSTLGNDYFRYDEAGHAVIGEATGEMHRLGDAVEVRLVEAAPVAGALRFEMLSEGKTVSRKKRPRPGLAGGRRRSGGRSRRRR